MKGIVVTGGYGFIGSAFIRYMLENTDYSVINIDKITPQSHPESIANLELSARYLFIEMDICNVSTVYDKFHNVDYIINFAAETHVDRSIGAWEKKDSKEERWQAKQDEFIHTNILGVQCMLEFAKKITGLKRFVQISTDEVYGSVEATSFEKDAFNTTNPYSATKGAGELMANAYFYTFGVPVCITRSCNNYGIWQGSEKLIPLTILRALEDKPIPVYGTGNNKRDWIFVEDNIRAILAIMEHGVDGEAYNIPGYNTRSNNELIKMILKALGKPKELMVMTRDRPGHDWEYRMDGERIRLVTDWAPKVTLEDGMLKTIEFYIDNADYFKEEQKRIGVLDRVNALLEASN